MTSKMFLAAAVLFSAGAVQAAEVQGPWIEARAGWDRSSPNSGIAYGAAAGYDFGVGEKTFLGLQAGLAGSSMKECIGNICATAGRDIEVLARGGGAVAKSTLLYAMAGYANSRIAVPAVGVGVNLSGFRAGAGVEQQLGSGDSKGKAQTYAKLEYRFTTYENDGGSRHQLTASLGVRF